eukprot:TRINITY_DN34805_c0_g1_i1.p1 TRINITY_DN34805_c0_g1~~TRINITY_DN34805_c0_g1_i1.p1  ORF type:complete len:399 (-),score=77.22 TRINITY_DN34805_c0_g1_i1:135-1331(-)
MKRPAAADVPAVAPKKRAGKASDNDPSDACDAEGVASERSTQRGVPPGFDGLFKLSGDIAMMRRYVEGLGYDAEAKPFGKLPSKKLVDGLRFLKALGDEIQSNTGPSKATLTSLSGFFYQRIPHKFDDGNWVNSLVDSEEKLQNKLALIEALSSIDVAWKVVREPDGNIPGPDVSNHDRLVDCYKRLKCRLEPIREGSDDAKIVQQYFEATRASLSIEICNIFALTTWGEKKRFEPHSKCKNRALLWHGAHPVHWLSIMSRGLEVPLPETPEVATRVLGQGVRFWETAAGAAEMACVANGPGRVLLFLAEVSLGTTGSVQRGSHRQKLPLDECQSMEVQGKLVPGRGRRRTVGGSDGIRVPCGPLVSQRGTRQRFTELAVYDASRIRMRFVVELELFQ